MNHSELLKSYEINKLDENTVFIYNKHFNFSYTKADSVVKYEFKGQYKYFGGLQCRFEKDSQQYKRLESNLCEIAESVLGENIQITDSITTHSITVGTKLIAKNNCIMNNGIGPALVIGKEYGVICYNINKEEIAVKSEVSDNHFFSTKESSDYFYGHFFDIVN